FPESPYHSNERVLEWILASLEHTVGRQHPDGAFDAFAPNERNLGPTLAVAFGLGETVRLVDDALGTPLRARILDAVRGACDFAFSREESHGFISNHRALFAMAFLDAHELLGDDRYRRRAREIVEGILAEQSVDGWYREYDGPDPGYESLGIAYLASYWKRTGARPVFESLCRSVEFFAHCVHPDGSVGGAYGSRHTSLYHPAGFEILAADVPMAAAVASFFRERLSRRNVLTPEAADVESFPTLAWSYLEACLAAPAAGTAEPSALPCQTLTGLRRFAGAGVAFVGAPAYYAVVHVARGGLCRVFDKRGGRIVYEDAGYLVRSGGRLWTSQRIGPGRALDSASPDQVVATTTFVEVRLEEMTPLRFVLLRLLNLTLFRSLTLGEWVRRRIVARLVTARRLGPFRLTRSVRFESDTIRFRDQLERDGTARAEEVILPRSFCAIYMGSARYFHLSDLEIVPRVPVGALADQLNATGVAGCAFALRFGAASQQGVVGSCLRADTERPAELVIDR
ncbi:MAG: hypothetical protein ACREQ9_10180, partial [Candidatus Binatia bacterium]